MAHSHSHSLSGPAPLGPAAAKIVVGALVVIGIAVLAGAVWPLLVIGLIEFSAIVVYANLGAKPESGMAVLAERAHTDSRSTVSTI